MGKGKVPKLDKNKRETSLLPSSAANKVKEDLLQRVSFSFHFLQLKHSKFTIVGRQFNYFETLINRLQHISSMERKELSGAYSEALKHHIIQWEETTERCFGIPNEENIVEKPMQLCTVSKSLHGRVHGFFIGSVFYIVWLDPNHLLYPKK